jgi:O-antigen/teichoic acid export membrane protein
VKQTAIYGVSTIVGRLLNYLLVPFYTRIFVPSEYGVITELYAYVAFFLVLLTYGLETGYFRYSNADGEEKSLYSNLLLFLGLSSVLFVVIFVFISPAVASLIDYANHSEYILYLAIIVAIDAFLALPFARLRYLEKAGYFAFAKLVNIGVNIAFNLFFYLLIPFFIKHQYFTSFTVFFPDIHTVKYVFISNLIASVATFIALIPQLRVFRFKINFPLLRKVVTYSFPLLLVGLTGMGIESLDKVLLKHFIVVPPGITDASKYIMAEIGIYGANFKLAVFMSLFIQAYRFASEPLFFAQAKEKNAKEIYAALMNYFVLFGLLIFLAIMLFIDISKHFIAESYFAGLSVVPILLIAKLIFGIVFNLSIWYKLTNQTSYGIIISVSGLVVSVVLNIILIPLYSYVGSAWAALASYFVMAFLSYCLGRKYYNIDYPFKRIGFYFLTALSIFMLYNFTKNYLASWSYLYSSVLFLVFVVIVAYKENLRAVIGRRRISK